MGFWTLRKRKGIPRCADSVAEETQEAPRDTGAGGRGTGLKTGHYMKKFGGARRNRTADMGFADLCLTT